MKRQRYKRKKRTFAFFLCLLLYITSFFPFLPEPIKAMAAEEKTTVYLNTAEDLIQLSKDCVYDTYADDKRIVLKSDIDMTGYSFSPIPMFGGIFEGNGYTIKGVSCEQVGSVQGLFGTIRESGEVYNLTAEITLFPTGSKSNIGGIAGVNFGKIYNCTVKGEIEGLEEIGGIAGTNNATGTISHCINEAVIRGTNATGGITGRNNGTIFDCKNYGQINTKENSKAEDTGGICGLSYGRIEQCTNYGEVGYLHTGYNVGGIAGRQNRYVIECMNYADIYGRKDVGGIVGQFEPYTTIVYEEDMIQAMERELSELTDHMNRVMNEAETALAEVSAAASNISNQITRLGDASVETLESLKKEIEDLTLQANLIMGNLNVQLSAVSEKMMGTLETVDKMMLDAGDMFDDIRDMMAEAEDMVYNARKLFKNLEDSIEDAGNRIQDILKELSGYDQVIDELLKRMKDIFDSIPVTGGSYFPFPASDSVLSEGKATKEAARGNYAVVVGTMADTAGEDFVEEIMENIVVDASEADNGLSGSIINHSVNYGTINGDLNVGGIAGAAALEIDADPEQDAEVLGEKSLKSTAYIKANIEECTNEGSIAAKNSYAGGITGRSQIGAIQRSKNTGSVKTANGNYCGGIAGASEGLISYAYAACDLEGNDYVGGIAGEGKDITCCSSMVSIVSEGECIGAIAGKAKGELFSNYFVLQETAGVNGINFEGQAMPLSYEEFIQNQMLPEEFRKLKITFMAENNPVDTIWVDYGSGIVPEALPVVPEKEGMYAEWEEFERESIIKSQTVQALYREWTKTIASEGEKPKILLEGQFYPDAEVFAQKADIFHEIPDGYSFAEACEFSIDMSKVKSTDQIYVHVRPEVKVKNPFIGILTEEGFILIRPEQEGSYLIFPTSTAGSFYILEKKESMLPLVLAGAAAIPFAAGVFFYLKRKKERKIKQSID